MFGGNGFKNRIETINLKLNAFALDDLMSKIDLIRISIKMSMDHDIECRITALHSELNKALSHQME